MVIATPCNNRAAVNVFDELNTWIDFTYTVDAAHAEKAAAILEAARLEWYDNDNPPAIGDAFAAALAAAGIPYFAATLSQSDMIDYGYTWRGMVPVTLAQARELFPFRPVYVLHEDNTESLADTFEDLEAADWRGELLGVEAGDYYTKEATTC